MKKTHNRSSELISAISNTRLTPPANAVKFKLSRLCVLPQALGRTASRPGSQHVESRQRTRKPVNSQTRWDRCEQGRLAVR
jgi:hypothetical protein